jgi:UDP-N-acetylglucosamine diphosphorylase / glucose-1-phosphate thymidylyltransferase / UDP-N-acetylgalactosamine diphosphorylase / glucosamine-1-phosphate N-acetyltransferase / galactosamine-1-phosphate N-acetyltransferase
VIFNSFFAKDGKMRIAIFEDKHAPGFAPIALTRPVFELLCGQFSARDRFVRFLNVSEWGAFLRPYLAESFQEEHPEARVNDFNWLGNERTLLLNGRWLPAAADFERLEQVFSEERHDVVGVCNGEIAFLLLETAESALLSDTAWDDPLANIASTRRIEEAGGRLVTRPWDLIDSNSEMLRLDFALRTVLTERSEGQTELASHASEGQIRSDAQIVIQGNPENVFIDSSAQIDPFVVLDARGGPISIDAAAKIQAFTRIEGPCHIGFGSQLFRANVKAGTTIGPVCRVGGEIENVIMHGHANKYHDGFLGHSYVCPWVNMGALTTNSDLKNDYSNVSVPLSGDPIQSGSKKVGSFFGDHSKTALCSQFNTGSSIGVMTMVLPGGELLPKHVPSFSRVWHGAIDDNLDLDSSLATARLAMSRRDMELSPASERLLRFLHRSTADERTRAVNRRRAKVSTQ